MKLTAEPATLRFLTAFACTAVRPVVCTTVYWNWKPAVIGPCVADVMSKFWIVPLTMNCTAGSVMSVLLLLTVVPVWLNTRSWMLFR